MFFMFLSSIVLKLKLTFTVFQDEREMLKKKKNWPTKSKKERMAKMKKKIKDRFWGKILKVLILFILIKKI